MRVSFETRPAYGLIVVTGPVDRHDAASVRASVRDRGARQDVSRIVLDVRDAVLTREARDELLELARAPECAAAGVITSDDLFVAELNMASLAARSRVRAFLQQSEAHRWLARGSIVQTGVDLPAEHPRLIGHGADPNARRRSLLEPRSGGESPAPARSATRARPGVRSEQVTPAQGIRKRR